MSDEIMENVSWTPLLEAFFKKTAEKCQCYAWMYSHATSIYERRRTWIDIPITIISSATGFLSVGSSTMFEGETKMASIALGVASLFISIMGSTKSYFAWDKKAEGCRISSVHYNKMFRFLVVEMGLPRDQRMRPSELLKYTKNEFDRLLETSYPLPPESIAAFKSRFGGDRYASVAKPEVANGLETVKVYNQEVEREHLTIRIPPDSVASPETGNVGKA